MFAAGEPESVKETTLCLVVEGRPPRRILLGFKKKGFGAGKITGFGGKIEPGETPATAAIRELEEEAGIRVAGENLQAIGRLEFLFPWMPDWNQLVHVFLAEKWAGSAREGKEMKPGWYQIGEIPFDQMWHDGSYWLPRLLAGERIHGSFVFDQDNETVTDVAIRSCDDWDQGGQLG